MDDKYNFSNKLENYKKYISNEDCNLFIPVGFGIVIFIVVCIHVVLFFNNNKPIYSNNDIYIWYYDGDYIELQNDSDEIVNVKIGDNSYNVCNSNNKKVKLGLNSSFGSIKIKVNNDIILLDYN